MRLSKIWLLSLSMCLASTNTRVVAEDAAGVANTPPAAASKEATPANAPETGMAPLRHGSLLALLPPAGTLAAVSGETSSNEAVQAVTSALRHKGYRVLSPAQVSARLAGHAPDGCRNPTTCDPELALATLRADAVVSLAIWQRDGTSRQVAVHVRRVHGFGQAEVAVGAAGLRSATTSALFAALEDSRQTHEVVVRIESQPNGASVHVDQTLTSRTPASISLLPGNHLLSVEAPGYVTRAQYIDVPEVATTPAVYRVQLSAAVPESSANASRELGEAPAPERSQSSVEVTSLQLGADEATASDEPAAADGEASVWNYVLGFALLGTATPFIANAIYAGSTHGNCVGAFDARNRCSERVTLGPAFYASLAVGSVALVSGVTFLVFQPLTNSTSGKPEGALLQWHQRF